METDRGRSASGRSEPTPAVRAVDRPTLCLGVGNLAIRVGRCTRTLKKRSQFPAVVLPPLAMPRFKHCERTILDVRSRQCRDEVLPLPFVLIIHLVQNGLKGPHERMILDNCRLCSLTNHSLLPRNTALEPLVWESKCGVCRGNDRSRGIQCDLTYISAPRFSDSQVLLKHLPFQMPERWHDMHCQPAQYLTRILAAQSIGQTRIVYHGRDRMRARGVWRIRPNRNSDAIGGWHQG